LPEAVWYIPNSEIVEAVLSLALIPDHLLDVVKGQENHPDFPHVNRFVLHGLSLEQLQAIKTMWRKTSGVDADPEVKAEDEELIAAEEPESPLYPLQRFPPFYDACAKILHILLCSREFIFFWVLYFCFVQNTASLWALLRLDHTNKCISRSYARLKAVEGAFYFFGSLGMVTLVIAKVWLDFICVRNCSFASLEYLLNVEYRKKDPLNRLLALCILLFTLLFCFMLFVIAAAAPHAYPVTVGALFISFMLMIYASLKLYYQTSFVGMQHVSGSVPDVILPMRFFEPSEKFLDWIMEYASLSDDELRVVGAKIRDMIARDEQRRSQLSWQMRIAEAFQSRLDYYM
jgi:hypothetical protein